MDDQLRFEQELSHEAHQVVSFPALKDERYKSFYFDYGNFGKTTCIWIDHGPYELPQLLIFHDNFLEFELEVTNFFSEYKDEFARLRTITQTLLLLNIL